MDFSRFKKLVESIFETSVEDIQNGSSLLMQSCIYEALLNQQEEDTLVRRIMKKVKKQKKGKKTPSKVKSKRKKGKGTSSTSKKKPALAKPSASTSKNTLKNGKSKGSGGSSNDKLSTSQGEKRQPRKRHRKRPKTSMLQTLRKFAAYKVKIPKERSQWAKKMADTHLESIRKYCKKNVPKYFSHLEYTGSFYEHLKAEDADELDIIVALDTKNAELTIEEVLPGYARIKATSRSSKYWTKQFANGEGYVRPQKIRSWFFSVVQKAVNSYSFQLKDLVVKVFDNGPAIKLVIIDKAKETTLSVDLVPAFLFKEKGHGAARAEGKHYVAKILPKELASKHELPRGCTPNMLWRRSFSLDEKKKMQNLDKETGKENSGCRREVIKIIKTIVRNDATLAKLSSFHIKTTFLHYNFDEGKEQLDWSGEQLPERFYEMLDYLRQCVRAKQLQHFFIPEANLLEELSDTTLINIDNRLTKLIENENEVRKVLDYGDLETTDSQKPKPKRRKLDSRKTFV